MLHFLHKGDMERCHTLGFLSVDINCCISACRWDGLLQDGDGLPIPIEELRSKAVCIVALHIQPQRRSRPRKSQNLHLINGYHELFGNKREKTRWFWTKSQEIGVLGSIQTQLSDNDES